MRASLKSNNHNNPSRLRSHLMAAVLIIAGLGAILAANAFELQFLKVRIDLILAHIGALILVVALLQWMFDNYVRREFFAEIRGEIVGSHSVQESEIDAFCADSKDVDFEEYFLSSTEIVVGVNYSAKLIDNCMTLLKDRTERGLKTKIV